MAKKLWALTRFLTFLDHAEVDELGLLGTGAVYDFLASGGQWTASTRTTVLFFLREYLRLLAERGVVDARLGGMFPVIVANPDARCCPQCSPLTRWPGRWMRSRRGHRRGTR